MQKYVCTHTFTPGAFNQEQVCQLAEASQNESQIRGYRSFFNLTEGKVWCVIEGENRDAVARWFDKMEIPYDSIDEVELEGERGVITDLKEQPILT
jgi:hypothetical protein